MKGVNVAVVSGNVDSVRFSTTKTRGDEVCTFLLCIEKNKESVTWARVNVYGGNVLSCRKFLKRGSPVVIEAELMNRLCQKTNDKVVELRCNDIKFI